MRHLVIPDTQVSPGVPIDHMTWIGRAILEYRPDVIIHLGDHWTMDSLSSYASRREAENKRYIKDVDAGNEAMKALLAPLMRYNQRAKRPYLPRKVFLMGNHENRIQRGIDEQPYLEGWMSYEDLYLEEWEVIDYLKPIELDGVWYAHFFYNPNSGRALGGTAHTKLKNIGLSFTMGHQQGYDTAVRQLVNGKRQYGLVVGSCYLHYEGYRGPQANNEWRGIIVKNAVKDGEYDIMPLSLDYLKTRFG